MHGMDEVDLVHGTDGAGGVYGSSAEESVPVRGKGQHVLVVVQDPAIAELLSTTMELADPMRWGRCSWCRAPWHLRDIRRCIRRPPPAPDR
jgi:hypothetical protein